MNDISENKKVDPWTDYSPEGKVFLFFIIITIGFLSALFTITLHVAPIILLIIFGGMYIFVDSIESGNAKKRKGLEYEDKTDNTTTSSGFYSYS